MTSDSKMLPLPPIPKEAANGNFPSINQYAVDYARGNVTHATAPLQAEIEALRAEVVHLTRTMEATTHLLERAAEEMDRREALAQQSAACTHSWHDYGTVNRAWCSRCNAVAVIGHEDRPYGVLSVTDDGEYRTNPTQQPTAVDEAMVDEALRSWFECDDWPSLLSGIEGVDRCRSRMLRALTAALAGQQGGA